MITKGLLAASAATAALGATVIVTPVPAHADDQYWGAIAYSHIDGVSGTSSQQPSESDATSAAILDCGNNGGTSCAMAVTVQRPNCASLVANETWYSTGVAQHPNEAKQLALADLGEPGTEVTTTCGFIAGTSAGPTAPAPTAPASPTRRPHTPPQPTAKVPVAPAPA
jgi:hypothetical protein